MKGQVLDPSRSRGMTVIQRSIFDGVSGPRSGLCEDFIEREKGLGTLCEGASPRSLAEPRDDSYTKVTPRRICDRVSGPRSGLYEDFIEREKGLGTLRRYVKGQVLDPSRSRGMTVIQRSRLGASATHLGRGDRTPGPSRPFVSHEEGFQLGSRLRRIYDRVSGPRSGLCEDFIEREGDWEP